MDSVKKYIRSFPSFLKSATKKGFFHILVGNTLVKFISFFSAMLIPKILTKAEYANLGFVDTILTYILLVNAFGLANSILRFSSLADNDPERSAIFKFSIKLGLIIDFILVALMVPFVIFLPFPDSFGDARWPLLFALCIPIITFLFDSATYFLRANGKNKEFSFVSILFTIISASAQMLLAWKFRVFGAFAGRYISYFVATAVTFWIIFNFLKPKDKLLSNESKFILDKKYKKAIFVFGICAMIANSFSLIMPINEKMVINLLLNNDVATANYNVASLLPQSLQFITNSIIVFVYPYFARNSYNGKWIWQKYKQMTVMLSLLFLVISIIGIIFTPFIINLIYGSKYNDTIGLMRFMWITFGINSALRMPAGNILAAIGEIKFNLTVSIISCVIHLPLDLIFISTLGINGAAYALTITYIISAVISAFFLKKRCSQMIKNEEANENE